MSKVKNVTLGIGMLVGFSASLLPLAAYATDPNCTDFSLDSSPTTCDFDVNVNVNPVISMSVTSYGADPASTISCASYNDPTCTGSASSSTEVAPGEVDLTTMYSVITVSTNEAGGYTLELIDADENTNLVSPAGNTIATINSKPAAASAATPNPGWAVSIGDTDVWQQMPNGASLNGSVAAGSPIVVTNYTPDPAAVVVDHTSTVHYGVATTVNQPSGTYTDTIVYTATTKQ